MPTQRSLVFPYHRPSLCSYSFATTPGSLSTSAFPITDRLNARRMLTLASFLASDANLPFLVCHLSVSSSEGLPASPMSLGATPTSASAHRLLYGTLVSSPHRLRNLEGKPGVYFLFPDVSIRERGRYRLGVTLLNIMRRVTRW